MQIREKIRSYILNMRHCMQFITSALLKKNIQIYPKRFIPHRLPPSPLSVHIDYINIVGFS